jgi:hypothetical protein
LQETFTDVLINLYHSCVDYTQLISCVVKDLLV